MKTSEQPMKFYGQSKLLNRIAANDRTAFGECLENYGSLVWNLAMHFTRSTIDAESAAQKIFSDIWQNAKEFDGEKNDEQTFIKVIALRRLLKTINKGEVYEQI